MVPIPLSWLFDQLAKEWGVIKQAPLSFALACLITSVILYFLFRWRYRERLDAQNEIIGLYREKLGLLPANDAANQITTRPQAEAELIAIRDSIASLHARLADAAKDQLVFEVDGAFRSRVKLERYDDNNDAVDDPMTRTYSLDGDLRIRFKNADALSRGVTALEFSIVSSSRSKQPLTYFLLPLTIQHPEDSEKREFLSLRVEGSDTTVWYAFVFSVVLPTECALSLDKSSLLRITMRATRQEPIFLDYRAPWKRAYGEFVPIGLVAESPNNVE